MKQTKNPMHSPRKSLAGSLVLTSLVGSVAALLLATPRAQAAPITFADFNVNQAPFTSIPATGSGSTANVAASSTASRVTTDDPREGTGHQRLVLDATTPGNPIRLRHLSGGGSPANNIPFVTSDAEDGWIGFYVKTTNTGWNVQLWIEGTTAGAANVNGGVPKEVIADGEWHLYEWNLDDNSGGPDGWGPIGGVLDGSATVANISHTIDSIVFRNPEAPETSVIFLDFVAKTASGSVSNLLLDPCINTSGVLVTGPLATNSNEVVVNGVLETATAVTVYQDSGSGMVPIGSKTTGITEGQNTVTVSGLVKAAEVVATQTVAGQESCIPQAGIFVGGGANPSVRVAITIRETSETGPIGGVSTSTSANLHFLGASALSGGAPINASVVYPSNDWQTLTFKYELFTVPDVVASDWAPVNGSGYDANDQIYLQIYAYRISGGLQVFSANAHYTVYASSNDVFSINWTWDAVPDADGYRLLRSLNFGLSDHYVDVPSNSYLDGNTGWTQSETITITPTVGSITPAIQWNGAAGTVGTLNNIGTPWGVLESINFAIHDADTGPFDLFIDTIQNGDTVFQTFDEVDAGTVDYGFRAPSFSGSTSSALLSAPNIGAVSDLASDSGANSFRVSYQWNGTNASKWLRLTTSGVGNPLVDLSQPISFKILLLPVGSAPATPPGDISITRSGNDIILNWTGSYYLQSASEVNGTYTDITERISGPYTNSLSTGNLFFRLRN